MHCLYRPVSILFFAFTAGLVCLPASAETAVILNSGDGSISLVDTLSYKETARFPIGKEPHHLMATPDDKELIVANAASNDLAFISPVTGEILRRLPRISDPYQIAYSPDKKWFASASNRLDRVDIYHAADFTLAKRIALPKVPSHIAFNRDSSLVFFTLQESDGGRTYVWDLGAVKAEY